MRGRHKTPAWMRAALAVFPVGLVGMALLVGLAAPPPASAQITADITIWSPRATDTGFGRDPNMSVADPAGLTSQVSTDDFPLTIVTVWENFGFTAPCAVVYWNPATNLFRGYGYSSGEMLGVDVNRGAPELTAPDGTSYGAGDTWLAKSSFRSVGDLPSAGCGSQCSLTVNFKGGGVMRHWEAGNMSSVAVDQVSGLIWVTDRDNGARISRFDPTTNGLTAWVVGGEPRDIAVDSAGAAYATVGCSNEIVRVEPGTNIVTRWTVPTAGGLQCGLSVFTNNPNGIGIDADGQVWFAESAGDKIGRLDPATGRICEYTKDALDEPQNLATSGSGDLLQTFFAERTGNALGVLTHVEAQGVLATETCTDVTPTSSEVTPVLATLAFRDRTIAALERTVPGVTTEVVGVDGAGPNPADPQTQTAAGDLIPGILRFPLPTDPMPFPASPVSSLNVVPLHATGMTQVAVLNTVHGSLIGSEQVYEMASGAIIAPPTGVDTDGDGILDDVDNCVATPNADQANSDNDALGDACDNCVLVDNGDQANQDNDQFGDVCDACVADADNDADGDSVCGDVDFCAGTTIDPLAVPAVPSRNLDETVIEVGKNRFAQLDGDPDFETSAPKGVGPQKVFTMADTRGCNCSQIIVFQDLGLGHEKFGCSISAMEDFVALMVFLDDLNDANNALTLAAATAVCDETTAGG